MAEVRSFYIQDLALCFVRSELFKYADDLTSLKMFMEQDRQEAIVHINQDLKRVLRWGKKWKTAFEPTKTHTMLVTNSKDMCTHPSIDLLEFDGVKIGFEKHLKTVGVIHDCKLTWSIKDGI